MSITCILLAAGLSTRFGGEKLLCEQDGVPIGIRAIRLHAALPYAERILVTRRVHTALITAAEAAGFTVAFNDDPARGISSSIRIGLAARSLETDGILFGVADQPSLTPATVRALMDAFTAHPRHITAPFHGGQRGNPVIFPASLVPELSALTGDTGGGRVIKAHPELLWPVETGEDREFSDVDTIGDLACHQRPRQ